MPKPKVFFVAAEASGDLLASEVITELRAREPNIDISGIGGVAMAKLGISSEIDLSPLSVLGFFEGLRVYADVVRLADEATELIIAENPDAVVLVDSWGFMVRVAERLRKRCPEIRLIKLVGPQVWATRPGRAKTLARLVDHLLCIHEMEIPFYAPYNLKTTVIGNPALSRIIDGDAQRFRDTYTLSGDQTAILVLPGSRPSEIQRVAPELVSAAKQLQSRDRGRRIFFAPAEGVRHLFLETYPDTETWATIIAPQDTYDAMAAANLALACSGTVTTELATQQTPMLVAYRTGWLTWAIARGFLYKKTHVTLLNIASDDHEIVPEFLQSELTVPALIRKSETLLGNEAVSAAQIAAQNEALGRMRREGASAAEISAEAILDEIGR